MEAFTLRASSCGRSRVYRRRIRLSRYVGLTQQIANLLNRGTQPLAHGVGIQADAVPFEISLDFGDDPAANVLWIVAVACNSHTEDQLQQALPLFRAEWFFVQDGSGFTPTRCAHDSFDLFKFGFKWQAESASPMQ